MELIGRLYHGVKLAKNRQKRSQPVGISTAKARSLPMVSDRSNLARPRIEAGSCARSDSISLPITNAVAACDRPCAQNRISGFAARFLTHCERAARTVLTTTRLPTDA